VRRGRNVGAPVHEAEGKGATEVGQTRAPNRGGGRARVGLGPFLLLCLVGFGLVLVSLYGTLYGGARRTVLGASARLMEELSRRATDQIEDHLAEAERALAAVEAPLGWGVIDARAPAAIEASLLAALGGSSDVALVAFTGARAAGVFAADQDDHEAGELRLAPEGRFQVAVERDGGNAILVHATHAEAASFVTRTRTLGARVGLAPAAPRPAADPTRHDTFTVPSRPDRRGQLLWSDLAYAEADAQKPEAQRRRVVSVQKAIWNAGGEFVGVVKVELLSDRIDRLAQLPVEAQGQADPHRIFLADRAGRLVARLAPGDRTMLIDAAGKPDPSGDLRVSAHDLPAGIAEVLRRMRELAPLAGRSRLGRIDGDGAAGGPYLTYLAALPETRTQGWLVGVVVPEAHHLARLAAAGRRSVLLAGVLMVVAILAAAVALAALRNDLARVFAETQRLRGFVFAPTPPRRSTFREIAGLLDGLEQAKTALRALGKYAPLDLVRQLFERRQEPVLGGEPRDVTILFSDIEGFTSLSEKLPQTVLAQALGIYLEAITRAVHEAGGVIDKYTGDGVMALFNAPAALADHPAQACAAALNALLACAAVFKSAAWTEAGLPALGTRIGIHRARVTVGHFGAPDRLSYTAMGDGVNLASRLEGLNKQFGTKILVSAAVADAARDRFSFRALGTAVVKGKTESVAVFELLGPAPAAPPAPAV
jgi:adenylate cyclase